MNDGHFTTSLNNGLLIFHKDHDHTFLTKTTGDSINSKKIIIFLSMSYSYFEIKPIIYGFPYIII